MLNRQLGGGILGVGRARETVGQADVRLRALDYGPVGQLELAGSQVLLQVLRRGGAEVRVSLIYYYYLRSVRDYQSAIWPRVWTETRY